MLLGESDFVRDCTERVLSGEPVSMEDAGRLFCVQDGDLEGLAGAADEITREFNGTGVDVEQLDNIRKNGCSEDCTFCGQSALYNTGIDTYRLPPAEDILERARQAKLDGAGSYCLVAAWREPPAGDFERVCEAVAMIRGEVGISVECSLGFLTPGQARRLKDAGVARYNHNLETARSKFPEICTTHTYDDRVRTLMAARGAGLELCTGGIIGMGETAGQRLELAGEIAGIRPEEVTVNILVPVPGTPLELQSPLGGRDIVRMFAVLRFLLPESVIKISGGREAALADSGEALLRGGANGIITGGYLTMGGNSPARDIGMIKKIGLDC